MSDPEGTNYRFSQNMGHPQPQSHPWRKETALHPWRNKTPFKRSKGLARIQDLKAAHNRVKERKQGEHDGDHL